MTPLLVASHEPNYWALYIYLAVVTAAAFALARMRLWRWLAITAVALRLLLAVAGHRATRASTRSTRICSTSSRASRWSRRMIVAGLFYGPPAEPGQIDPVSCRRARRPICFGALLLVLASRHDPAALTVFTLLTVATLAIAWRTEAAAGAVPVAAVLAGIVILRWALAPEIAQLIAPAGRRRRRRAAALAAPTSARI